MQTESNENSFIGSEYTNRLYGWKYNGIARQKRTSVTEYGASSFLSIMLKALKFQNTNMIKILESSDISIIMKLDIIF